MDFYKILMGGVGVGMSNFDRLFAEKHGGGAWQLTTITGTLPLTVLANGKALKNYKIYGTSEGAGVETENLFNITNVAQVTVPEVGNRYGVVYSGAGEYTIKTYGNTSNYLYAYQYNENNECVAFVWIVQTPGARQHTFTLNSGDTLYLVAAIDSTTYNSAITLFTNWLPVVCNGSTAPASYIPHGYKLPLTVESGAQSQDIPIYIGDSKLGEEEYVDYQEQKVYKRTENDFPFAKKGTFTFGNDGYIISNGEGKFFAAIPTSVSSTVNSVLIPLNETYTIPQSLDTGGEFIFYLRNNVTKSGLLLVLYDANGVQIENWAFTSKWRKITAYNQMAGKTIAYIGLHTVSNGERGNIELAPMFSKNDNLTTYIPYLQPTDPPVPLPEIPTYEGENTLSCSETLGEVSITGYIKEVDVVDKEKEGEL